MRKPFPWFAVALLALLPAPVSGRTDVYAVVDARILPVSGPVIEKGTLLLRDGVIEAVGSAVRVPVDAQVIPGEGLTLTPGLIDGFGGIGLPARTGKKRSEDARAEERALAPEALALQRVDPGAAREARSQGITTALVIGSDGVLPGQSVLLDFSGETAEDMVLRQPAALHLHMATRADGYPGSLMGTMAYVRQSLLDAAHAKEAWAAFERSPRGRKRPQFSARLAAWQQVIDRRIPLMVTARTENDVRRALALADEFGIRVVLAGAPQAARVADLIARRRVGLVLGVNFDPETPVEQGDDDEQKAGIEAAERAAAELERAGVLFGLGSGHTADYLAGVRKAIARGLSSDGALRALTLGAAEAIGVADRTGSLEPGKLANVVAWRGAPLADGSKVEMVFVDGRLYEPEPKDEEARDDEACRKDGEPARPEAPATEPEADGASLDSRGRTLAIVGGTILTVAAQGTIEQGTLLVRDGKIVAVGRDVAVPAGATLVDASGRYVMPGIVDAHAHTAIEGAVNECTDSVTAEVRVRDVLDPQDAGLRRLVAGGVTTLHTMHGSCNTIGGQNVVIKLRRVRSPGELVFEQAPRTIKLALGENVKRSGERGPSRYPGTRMGVEATIRQAFDDALAYEREWQEHERALRAAGGKGERPLAPRRDLRKEALVETLRGKLLVRAHAYRADEMLMLMRIAEEYGISVRCFEHGLEGYKIASEIARHGAGVATFSDWWAYKMEAFDAIPQNAAVLAAHGVRVSLKSDFDELSRRLYWEAAKVMKYGGVSETEALRMITLNPAWQLGVDRHVGSLEPGKDADVAIFSAHPFSPDARVEMTLVDGAVVFERSRESVSAGSAAQAGGGR